MRGFLLAAVASAGLTGCGTLASVLPTHVYVDTRPEGALVLCEGREAGVTPCTIELARSSRVLELRLPGHHSQALHLGSVGNPWVAANVVTLGLGAIVDVVVGADQLPNTEPVLVWLRPLDAPSGSQWQRAARPPAAIPEPLPPDAPSWVVVMHLAAHFLIPVTNSR